MTDDTAGFPRLVEIMRRLRAPGGCPWDAEQTHESLKRYLIEECYEVIEAIDEANQDKLQEELGDLMLQPVFHAVIAEEAGQFSIEDVLATVCSKLVRRHPHVFGDMKIADSAAQVENWEKIKQVEKGTERKSALAGVPPQLPALLKAQKITEKASRVGFDWEHTDQVVAKVHEELHELTEAIATGNCQHIEWELGDLLFAIVNLGRFLDVNPEDALRRTVDRFAQRFSFIEQSLEEVGSNIRNATVEEMEHLWQKAKQTERE